MDIRRMGQVAALILPLCIACNTSEAKIPKTDLLETTAVSQSESVLAQTASADLTQLRQVPPNGLDSLDETGFRYFQTMGPMEYATRLGGVPNAPTWRVRVRLYPNWQNADLVYQVKVDHYNLSPTLYRNLVRSYGAGNVDPRLDDSTPHSSIALEFLPIMNVAADWIPDSTQISQSGVDLNPTCGLGLGCASLEAPNDLSEWGPNEANIALDAAPWDTENESLYGLVRALAKQAGWLEDGWILPSEIPEGISAERPWVEVLVTNYAGNGGGYMAQWIEYGADDSIRAKVYQIYVDDIGTSGNASTGYICGRGSRAGQISQVCP
ncbi:MAG: hypothetical protein AAGF93_07910 [Cyanobacteria bacterium P01_H01_bin.105]